MSSIETKFWKYITRFGWLPWIIIPIWFIVMIWTINLSQNYNSMLLAIIVACWWITTSYIIGIVIKYFYYKPRPVPQDTSTIVKKINAWSMPSIHSSNSLITAIALILMAYSFVGSTMLIYLVVSMGFWYYLAIALSRIALQKHYPIDVLMGSLMWLTISIVMILVSNTVIDFLQPIIYYIIG